MTSVYFLMIRELRTTKIHHHHHHLLMITALFFFGRSICSTKKNHSNPKSPEKQLGPLDPSIRSLRFPPTALVQRSRRRSTRSLLGTPVRRRLEAPRLRACGALLNRNEKKGGEELEASAKVAISMQKQKETVIHEIWRLKTLEGLGNEQSNHGPHSFWGLGSEKPPKISKQIQVWQLDYLITKIGQIEFQVNSPADSLDSLLSKVLAHLSHSFHVFSCLKSPSQVMQSMGFDLSEDRKQNIPIRNQQSSYDNLQQLTTTTTTTFRLSCESAGWRPTPWQYVLWFGSRAQHMKGFMTSSSIGNDKVKARHSRDLSMRYWVFL